MGGELTDLLVVLRSKAAVNAFCGTIAAGVGGAAAFAAGPLGRQADAGITMGRGGAALCYSYSISRGAFAGAQCTAQCSAFAVAQRNAQCSRACRSLVGRRLQCSRCLQRVVQQC